jgi:alkanesulfonate monooxygenase SsuD/methylene tetrahydromethanopterin reductase-like flavin-dependent oxidoreductase (luciferase family)
LLHYFATPLEVRARVEAAYRLAAEQAGHDSGAAPHVHVLTTWVTDDETGARVRLRENLLPSFAAREHPRVAQAGNRHVGPDGRPLDRGMLADFAARGALVGSPARLAETLAPLHNEQGIRRFVLYMEPIAERDELLESIERFAKEVAPQLTAEVGCTNGSTRS